ncbi:MAG TPA: hypothetical protein VE526_02020 [Solirubrobacteraceae bacterium]|nr:hypothetical protein [Solirubrobacteraceae bacterium]
MSRLTRAAACAVALVLLAPAVAAAEVPEGGLALLDRPTGAGPPPFDGVDAAEIGPRSMSADGCKVVFTSSNDVLWPFDDDRGRDVYRVDRCAPGRPLVLVSATAAGEPADGDAHAPTISADGNRVAFITDARNLLQTDGVRRMESVVVKDLTSGEVTLAARSHGPSTPAAQAYRAVISGDGTAVAFSGVGPIHAVNGDGTASYYDLYVRFLAGAQTVKVTAGAAQSSGARGDGFDLSHDGRRVAFVSSTAFAPPDTGYDDDAYLTTVSPAGSVAHQLASSGDRIQTAALSGDGTWVAYADDRVWMRSCAADPCQPANHVDGAPAGSGQTIEGLAFARSAGALTRLAWTTNRALLAEDVNGARDLYAATVARVPQLSLPLGSPARGAGAGAVSADGSVAVGQSPSPELPGTDGSRAQVFARAGGETTLLSQPAGAAPRVAETDGSYVGRRAVSALGRRVVMETVSPALGAPLRAGTTQRAGQVIVRDLAAGTTAVVSAGPDGAPANRSASQPTIDDAGAVVAFASRATNLVADATGGDRHVYVRDLATGKTRLVDRRADGAPVTGEVRNPSLSRDGTRLGFVARSADLAGGDAYPHAYVADLSSGAIHLVDTTADGTPGNGAVDEVVLDADGSRAAFTSAATNLGAASSGQKAFRKDLATGELTYVSVPESGTPSQTADEPSIDASGDRVTWLEYAADFGYGSDGGIHVFLRDLPAGTTVLASTGGPGESGASYEPDGELDASGTRLAFLRSDPRAGEQPLLRDLAAGTTTPLVAEPAPGYGISLSADGRCAAFGSTAPDLTAEHVSPDFDHVYLRAAGAACAPGAADGPGPGGPGAGGAGADATAPVITGLRMTRARFAVARGATARLARRTRRGSVFVFALSEDAPTRIAVARARPGGRASARFAPVGSLTRAQTGQGVNRVRFTGRIGRRGLPPGRYRATVRANDAAGNRSAARRVAFRIAP